MSPLWSTFSIPDNHTHTWKTNEFSLSFRISVNDLLIAPFYHPYSEDNSQHPFHTTPSPLDPPNFSWRRWSLEYDSIDLYLRPKLPDRPLVVHARRPFLLPPGSDTLFYIQFPVFICVYLANNAHHAVPLDTFPSHIFSDTWFGDPISGTLCYSLKTRARRALEDFPTLSNRAITPVIIHNASKEPLDYHKICLRPQYLNIYDTNNGLWTNTVHAQYIGEESASILEYETSPPEQVQDPHLLAQAQETSKENFITRTFGAKPLIRQRLH